MLSEGGSVERLLGLRVQNEVLLKTYRSFRP